MSFTTTKILKLLPYQKPFLFVDRLLEIDEQHISGTYHFHEQHDFYKGHFKSHPVTPGVILTECAAQIGLVSLGIYLLSNQQDNFEHLQCVMTSAEIEFLEPVLPGEQVRVEADKVYFRFNKLKSAVKLYNANGDLALKGYISGMIINASNGK